MGIDRCLDPLTCRRCSRPKKEIVWKESWKHHEGLYKLKETLIGSKQDKEGNR